MKGMHADTGRAIAGIEHLHQSVATILTTPIGTRVQRRPFGAGIADLIDAPNNGATRVRLYAAIAAALMRWEPRLVLTRVSLSDDALATANGAQFIDIEGHTLETGDPLSTRVPLGGRRAEGASA